MSPGPQRKYAPNCGHDFTVVHVRGDRHAAANIVLDLRQSYEGHHYVSEPYQSSTEWVFALCKECEAGRRSGC